MNTGSRGLSSGHMLPWSPCALQAKGNRVVSAGNLCRTSAWQLFSVATNKTRTCHLILLIYRFDVVFVVRDQCVMTDDSWLWLDVLCDWSSNVNGSKTVLEPICVKFERFRSRTCTQKWHGMHNGPITQAQSLAPKKVVWGARLPGSWQSISRWKGRNLQITE